MEDKETAIIVRFNHKKYIKGNYQVFSKLYNRINQRVQNFYNPSGLPFHLKYSQKNFFVGKASG